MLKANAALLYHRPWPRANPGSEHGDEQIGQV